ncbi:hypothetical protein B0O99DRAFT_683750 [Bisporella sp. PMI_857]|nr:hypothetical protein B0O99DRAFT_683750 [Bisporella sp. PMI_857]
MAAHPQQSNHSEDQAYNEQWELACSICYETTSASRPPIYNARNCPCINLSGLTIAEHDQSPSPQEQQVYEEPTYLPQSRCTSELSVSCPEGPEREDPSMRTNTNGNRFLPIVPPLGLNEAQHRRSASFHSDLSYPMLLFLSSSSDLPSLPSYVTNPSSTRYLSQDLHIQFQRREKKNGNGSKMSWQSRSSSSGGYRGFTGFGADPMVAVGAWDDGWEGEGAGGYAMAMSEMTEYGDLPEGR